MKKTMNDRCWSNLEYHYESNTTNRLKNAKKIEKLKTVNMQINGEFRLKLAISWI